MTTATKVLLKLQALTEEQQHQVLEFMNRLPAGLAPPRTHLYGLFKGFDTPEEAIAEARAEMWRDFPREDL